MSRVSILEQLRAKRKSALDFHYEELWAPPIMTLFTPQDVQELYSIATSIRYNGNIDKKYELIDNVMVRRGFRRAHCGTNRVVYNFLESSAFVAKVAVDKVGMTDSPAEYKNQVYFQPFCCRIFEVDPTGVIAFVERVNPISSLEEFISIKDDVFNMMITKIIGKYVVDDLGTKTYMNFGIRQNANGHTFGPVIIDFPYVYELDGAKLICQKPINTQFGVQACGGDIDYTPGFNGLICTKCGREYKAMDLAKDESLVKFHYDDTDKELAKKLKFMMRARIIDGNKVVKDSGRRTDRYLTKEEFEIMNRDRLPANSSIEVDRTVKKRYKPQRKVREEYYTALQRQYYNELQSQGPFNPVIRQEQQKQIVESQVKKRYADINTNSKSDAEDSDNRTGIVVDATITADSINSDVEELERQTFPEIKINELINGHGYDINQTVNSTTASVVVDENTSVDAENASADAASTLPKIAITGSEHNNLDSIIDKFFNTKTSIEINSEVDEVIDKPDNTSDESVLEEQPQEVAIEVSATEENLHLDTDDTQEQAEEVGNGQVVDEIQPEQHYQSQQKSDDNNKSFTSSLVGVVEDTIAAKGAPNNHNSDYDDDYDDYDSHGAYRQQRKNKAKTKKQRKAYRNNKQRGYFDDESNIDEY